MKTLTTTLPALPLLPCRIAEAHTEAETALKAVEDAALRMVGDDEDDAVYLAAEARYRAAGLRYDALVLAEQGKEPDPDAPAPVADRYRITDRDGLSWYTKKLLRFDSTRKALTAEFQQIQAEYAAMLAQVDGDEAGFKHLYSAEAEATARELIEQEPGDRKSLRTMYGRVGFRTAPAVLTITEPGDAFDTAKILGLVRTREEIAKDEYLKAAAEALERTGEMLPGVSKVPEHEVFGVTLQGPARTKKKATEGTETATDASAETAGKPQA